MTFKLSSMSVTARDGLNVVIVKFPNVVGYGDDSVYDKSSDKCVHGQ